MDISKQDLYLNSYLDFNKNIKINKIEDTIDYEEENKDNANNEYDEYYHFLFDIIYDNNINNNNKNNDGNKLEHKNKDNFDDFNNYNNSIFFSQINDVEALILKKAPLPLVPLNFNQINELKLGVKLIRDKLIEIKTNKKLDIKVNNLYKYRT